MTTRFRDLERLSEIVAGLSYLDRGQHPRVSQLTSNQLLIKYFCCLVDTKFENPFDEREPNRRLTLSLFDFMHLMKEGMAWLRVSVSCSRDTWQEQSDGFTSTKVCP